jgi:uncharacterized protein YjbI with pentapeptide repeats
MMRRMSLRTRRPRWWVVGVVVACALTMAATWLALDLLLGEADRAGAADRAVARIDAIRTGLGVAAGAGALVALVLALRRQWHTEHDATEQRITELYVKSVEQLGSEHAPVRLGGLHALARLAEDNPMQRQTVVDVVCAYLRMPFTVPAPDDKSGKQELQVRLTAQNLLAKHLSGPTPWRDIDLDLMGATLVDLNLYDCRVRTGVFRHATFVGNIANFAVTRFGEAEFDNATFETFAVFVDTTFHSVSFAHAIFRRPELLDSANQDDLDALYFCTTRFSGPSHFDSATFEPEMSFLQARFEEPVFFTGATFHRSAVFRSAMFTESAVFDRAAFHNGIDLTDAVIRKPVDGLIPPVGWVTKAQGRDWLLVPSGAVDGDRVVGAGE